MKELAAWTHALHPAWRNSFSSLNELWVLFLHLFESKILFHLLHLNNKTPLFLNQDGSWTIKGVTWKETDDDEDTWSKCDG